jgi:hypothetical protein
MKALQSKGAGVSLFGAGVGTILSSQAPFNHSQPPLQDLSLLLAQVLPPETAATRTKSAAT